MSSIGILKKGWLQKPPLGVQINRAHPLARGLIGCWLFNEGGGDKVYDLSGYCNHGTLNGFAFPATTTSGWNPGRDGIGLTFDGTNDYVDCADGDFPIGTASRTVEIWIKRSSPDNFTYYPYAFFYGTKSAGQAFGLYGYINTTDIMFYMHGENDFDTGINLNDTNWHHIVVTYDGT